MPLFALLILLFFNIDSFYGLLNTYKITGYAQGTTYSITYFARSERVQKKEIDGILAGLDSSLSIYKPYSLINKFNNSSTGSEIDSHLKKVVKESLRISHRTKGAFDITVLPLVKAWGFGPVKLQTLPDSNAIKNILPCIGFHKLNLTAQYLAKEKSCIEIDVNGIAQGYSVDVLSEYLKKKEIENFLVEIGGEIVVEGKKPTGELLAIGIESPGENDNNPIQKKIKIKKGAITTSGNYRRFYQSGGKKISHLIDSKTGYSLQNEMISVTVYAKTAMVADGYDNALMSMGIEESFRFLKKHKNLQAYFIYQKPDGTVADTASSGFYKLLNK